MDGARVFALFAEAAPDVGGFPWSHGIVAGVAGIIGAAAVPFFQHLTQKYAISKSAEAAKWEAERKALAAENDRISRAQDKLRNDLMQEVLENRKQIASLQQDNLKYLKENLELHATIRELQATIKSLQEENASQRVRMGEMQKTLDGLGLTSTPAPADDASAAEKAAEASLTEKAMAVATDAAHSAARSAGAAAAAATLAQTASRTP